MLTGHRDVDYRILNELNDKSLVNFCETSKQADEYCNDQNFWMNRILTKFPYLSLNKLRRYKGDRSWSEYYIQDLIKVKLPDDRESAINNIRNILEDGRFDHIKILVERGIPEEYREFFVHYAVYFGETTILKYLLSRGFSIGDVNDRLRFAGNIRMLKHLEKLGANIQNNYHDLLKLAIVRGFLFMVGYLYDLGLDIHFNNEEPLLKAACFGRRETVKFLVEREANIHVNNEATLRCASANGYLDIVKYLVEHGADIHANFNSAVREAHEKGRVNVVDYLVSQGAADPRIY